MRTLKKSLYFKAWQDHLMLKEFQRKTNVSTLRICEINRELLIQQCFNALRRNKECCKLELMD